MIDYCERRLSDISVLVRLCTDHMLLFPTRPNPLAASGERANFDLYASAPHLMRLCSFRQTIKLIYVTCMYHLYLSSA